MGISDHYLPFCVRKCKLPKRPPKYIQIRNYKNYSKDDFLQQLGQVPWWVLDLFNDPHDMLYGFTCLFSEIANACAPFINKKVKGIDTPWITGEIRQLMSLRDQTKVQAIKRKDNELFLQYKSLRNQVVNKCRLAKKMHYKDLISQNLDTPNKLWKSLKKILPAKNKQITTTLQDENGIHSTDQAMADYFNSFFSTIGL